MEVKDALVVERARIDQLWAETGEMFTAALPRMMELWKLASERDMEKVRALPDDDLEIIVAMAMLSFNELLQQAGDRRFGE